MGKIWDTIKEIFLNTEGISDEKRIERKNNFINFVGDTIPDMVKPGSGTEIETVGTTSSGIVDTTGQNEDVNFQEIYDRIAADQKAQWEREDAIRKENQAREDNAIQRKIEDMKKAGVNPNLAYSMNGAASGGGITQATGKDYSQYQIEIEKSLTELENILDRELKADENTKDRITDIIKTVLSVATLITLKK